MKIYCQLSDCMFCNVHVPDGIRVVNHAVEVDEGVAALLVHTNGSIFTYAPWPGDSTIETEYEPSAANATDFEGNAQPPTYDPTASEIAETSGTSSDAPAAPGQS